LPSHLYDQIGRGYSARRRPDARIAAEIVDALGPARTVLNVGAGAGSYEPTDRRVVAVEPSPEMIRQRPPGAAPVMQASATALPFADGAFDATLAVLTVHHWPDRARGLAELRRVARERAVLLTWEADAAPFWLVDDYFPALAAVDRAIFDSMEALRRMLGPIEVRPVLVPHDCVDGFLGAYWRRPEAYLDEGVRRGISVWTKLGPAVEERAVRRLREDIASGRWADRNRDLVGLDAADMGLRLLVA
jgi:SAM-dependent methyltransferase